MNIQYYNDFILSEDYLDLEIKLLESEIAELEEIALNERRDELFSISKKGIKAGKAGKVALKVAKAGGKGAVKVLGAVAKLTARLLKKLLSKKKKMKASGRDTARLDTKINAARKKLSKFKSKT